MDMVLSPLVDACIGKLVDLAAEKVGMILGVKDELMKLQRRMERLSYFLEDAEKKSIEDTSISNWLGELKDVVYDADDILDLCRVHPTRLLEKDHLDQQTPSTPPPPRSVRSTPCFPLVSCFTGAKFRNEIAEEIKKLNDRLKEIEQDSSMLNISKIKPAEATVGRQVDDRPKTTPQLVKSEVVGQQMENATRLLVESIINEDNRKCSVLGIVGMGGIGKSTLARKVFNHASIDQHFPTKIWVCVSQSYSETELLKEIIRGAEGDYGKASSTAELAPILTSALSRNFFLVLDDVWSADVWKKLLKKPLQCASASGRVLVTTRNEDIAAEMLAKKVYDVKKMDDNDGWMLLCKKVFENYGEEEEMLSFKDIGIQIVKKCDGLPLAIEVIGGVLGSKDSTRRSEWEKILRSNAWSMVVQGELRGALYLSYEDLPTHLRQCFLYCSLYPEDAKIRRKDLIRYWVDEGFIRSIYGGDEGVLMEDIADDYYLELVSRSLLQAYDSEGCSMHDMLRSLAQSLIGDENVCLALSDATKTLNANAGLRKLRRLSLVIKEEAVMPTFDTMRWEHLRHLRTLLFFDGYNQNVLAANSHHLVEVLDHLRVLDLEGTDIEIFPDSLENLVHLRYLRLDRTRIRQLPDSIQNLVNLQSLSLSNCNNLHTLPKGITKLYNLRYLDFSNTPLTHMPKGLGPLKQLNSLDGYLAGDETSEGQSEGCNMNDLQNLSQLRKLKIKRIQRATTGTPAITNKSFLKEMYLDYYNWDNVDWEPPTPEKADIERAEKVLEELKPPRSIQLLEVRDHPGGGYPSWIETPPLFASSFPLLETIILYNCKSWTQLPPLGQLPQLKFLRIEGAGAIVNVGPEFAWGDHGRSVQSAFPRLETLVFCGLRKWKEWSLSAAAGDDDEIRSGETSKLIFPRLKELVLTGCPELRSLPAGLSRANSLQSMTLVYLKEMTEVNRLPCLTQLVVEGCDNLQRISQLPLLRKLEIKSCLELKDVSHLDALCFLDLVLLSGRVIANLPAWLVELVAATNRRQSSEAAHSSSTEIFGLRLKCDYDLFRRCLEGGDYWPIIQEFSEVTINAFYPPESLAYTRTPRTYKATLTY